ncbi:MAG: LptF/LptG family permease [Spirochaetia bacterium]|nr:LptF/LptG family permease [Spirochaetia bacterium]
MKLLHKMSLGLFLKYLISSVLFFVLILELLDIFSNLWRYINNEVPFREIMHVALLYLPKCIIFSLPISILFSVSYALGNFYANNELIAVFGCGVSLYKFVFPFIFAGIILSPLSFFFEESVVIKTYRQKSDLTYELLNSKKNFNNNNVTVADHINARIYHADFYNDSAKSLSGVIIIENRSENSVPVRIDAKSAKWNEEEGYWDFYNARIYSWDEEKKFYDLTCHDIFSDHSYQQDPESFRNVVKDVEEMEMADAKAWIATLKNAGLPYREALTEYYKRFSFTLTPLIVALISVSFTGKFRKNVLLMSLLMSMMMAAAYYILQMVLVLFAKMGYIHPVIGAWGAFIIFLIISLIMFKYADT